MLVLAIDTTTNIGTMALYDSEKGVIGEITLNVVQNHSAISMNILDTLLKLTATDKKNIDKIAVSIGPGSFTGIRIGVALAKGLALALKKPIAGINELDLLANMYTGDKDIISMLDARKERVFCGMYTHKNKKTILKGDYLAVELKEVLNRVDKEVVCVGDAALKYREIIEDILKEKVSFLPYSLNISRASLLAELALEKEDNLFSLEPYYVTKSQAEREKEQQ